MKLFFVLQIFIGTTLASLVACSTAPTHSANESRVPADNDRAASAYARRLSSSVPGCVRTGDAADSSARCCGYYRTEGSCDSKDYYPSCGRAWSSCTVSTECCSGSCVSNQCVPNGSACAFVTESCITDTQCCSGHCVSVVGDKICLGGANECAMVGQRCGSSNECCSGDCLMINGVGRCRPSARDPARRGESCVADSDCYSGLNCGPSKTCR